MTHGVYRVSGLKKWPCFCPLISLAHSGPICLPAQCFKC